MSLISLANRWFTELWSDGALSVADEIVSPNYAPDWIHIPKTGPEQVKNEVRYFRSIFPNLSYKIIESAEQANKVWIRYEGQGTQSGNAWGFEPTGKTAVFDGVTIFTIQDEMIVDRWGAFCMYDLFAELGHIPPFWEISQHFQKEK